MTRKITAHTRLTPAQAAEYHAVTAEFRSLWGAHGSAQWNMVRSMAPAVHNAGMGLPWAECIAAYRAAVARVRAAVEALA